MTLLGALGARLMSLFRSLRKPATRPPEDPETDIRRSEERLQLAVAGSNDALFDYDHARGVLVLSDAFQRWMGGGGNGTRYLEVDLDEVVSRIHPDHAATVYRAILACAEHGRSFDVEFMLAKPDGGYLWLQVRGRGVPLDHGYRVSGFASNISRRKVAEGLLHDTVDRLAAVLDNIAEGIVTLDERGRVCAVNAAAQQMFGIDRDTLVGEALTAYLTSTEPLPGWSQLADRQPREVRALRHNGEPFPAEFTVSTMEVRSDERFIVVLRDIAERRIAEDQLRAAIAESQAATRAKDEFLATMSHEIRTPMNGVLGMTQLLLDMDLTQEQRDTAHLIRTSGESLLTIINDILDFTRAGSGRLNVDAQPFDLRQAVREVVELLGRRHGPVDVYVDYPLDLPDRLVGDGGRVRQVLLNLLGNAMKFTRRGHVIVAVESQASGSPAARLGDDLVRLQISVEDSGPGIEARAQSKLFEPFTQADASTTRRFGGTGLGLAISRRLVELMGGEIGFESAPGQGSRFHFTLNLPRAEAPTAHAAALTGHRLLLVDDDARGRGILERCLLNAGAIVTAVASAPDAMQVLEREAFEVALIDDRMPDMDGLLLSELIRIDPAWASMRIVLMCTTGIRGVDESLAVDRALVKPLMPDYLLQELAALLADPTDAADSVRPQRRAAGGAGRVSVDPGSPVATWATSGFRPRLLLAEDNPVNQQVAVRMLEKLGCLTDVAGNGAEAVKLWRHFDYDLIFMDCQMPELDGLGAARRIRELEIAAQRPRTPIVAMTANAMDDDRTTCLAAGMDDYLSKPVSQDDLDAALGRWVGGHRAGDSGSQTVDRANLAGGGATG
ncbi:MAG: response regulator [Pseudomonadales bacterium]